LDGDKKSSFGDREITMTIRTMELLTAIAMFLFSLSLMWNIWSGGLNIGWVEGRGPGARKAKAW
jgi:putative tricarboxylic transport membrane protein